MSANDVIGELEQRVALVEATLANVRDDNGIWDRIFTESNWGMVVSDAKSGELLKMNPIFADMHGYCVHELIGKSMYDVFAPECHKDLPEIVHKTNQSGHHLFKSVHIRKDRTRFPVHIHSFEVTVKEASIRVVFVWDISESKRKEKELSQYRESLEELVKSRTEELERTNEQLKEIIHRETVERQKERTEPKIREGSVLSF